MQMSFITNETGKKTAIVLPIADYESLLEEIADLQSIIDRKNEPTKKFADFKNQLIADQLLS